MTAASDLLASAIISAGTPGVEFTPINLLTLVSEDNSPVVAASELDRGNSYFQAAGEHLGFLGSLDIPKRDATPDERDRLTGIIRWFRRELVQWQAEDDPKLGKLVALFVVSRSCELHGDFWTALADGPERNAELLTRLEGLLSSFKNQLNIESYTQRPISDKATLERFSEADRSGDWNTLARVWQQLRYAMSIFLHVILGQATKCLNRFGSKRMPHALKDNHQTAVLFQILMSLPIDYGLWLAVSSENPWLQFAAVLSFLAERHDLGRQSIGDRERAALADLFLKVSHDQARWGEWMRGFNSFPFQFTEIQQSLGHALKSVPESALEAYVSSIILTAMGGPSRKVVAECLRTFRSAAPAERRKALWKVAHERWRNWSFGAGSNEGRLHQIGHSDLDYAVVGYAHECMDSSERRAVRNEIVSKLSTLPSCWHHTHSDFISETCRQLSHLQPYEYAEKMTVSDDWLMVGRYFLPFDPKKDRYTALVFRAGQPPN